MENPTQAAMRAKGLTQLQVADLLGCGKANVSQAIHGLTLSRRVLDMVDALLGWTPGTARANAAAEAEQRRNRTREELK